MDQQAFQHIIETLCSLKRLATDRFKEFENDSEEEMKFKTGYETQNGKICVFPSPCYYTEPVEITCSDLKPNENVTLKMSIKDHADRVYMSHSHFKTDANGYLDLKTASSLGGDFKGVFPMGPLVTVHSVTPGLEALAYRKTTEAPDIYKLELFSGHLDSSAVINPENEKLLADTSHERFIMDSKIQKIEINSGRIRGVLFLPPGDGPFPLVIDLVGAGGGLNIIKSCLLASEGFASLALAYFAFNDLPKTIYDVELSYFDEAVKYMSNHDKIEKSKIGIMSFSSGSFFSLPISIYIKEVKAAVLVNGLPGRLVEPSKQFKDKTAMVEPIPADLSKIKLEENVLDVHDAVGSFEGHPNSQFPIEEADCNFLFLVSGDDRNWKSHEISVSIDRLKKANKNNGKLCYYEGAGHILQPPYAPFSAVVKHGLVNSFVKMGGSPKLHSDGEVQAWKETVNFLKKNLL